MIRHLLAPVLLCSLLGCGRGTEPQAKIGADTAKGDRSVAWSMIAVGDAHTCALTKGGIAYCWGWNDRNELGDGTFESRSTPTLVRTPLRFVSIAAGRFVTCGIASSGEAYCWGLLAPSTTVATPQLVKSGLRFTMLAIGQFKVCGIGTDASVYCWATVGSDPAAPTELPRNLSFRSLSSAKFRFCGATLDGKGYCWADAVSWSSSSAQLQPVPSTTSVLIVAGGDSSETVNQFFHGCAVGADSTAVCWGANSYGQLGDGTQTDRASGVAVQGRLKFTNIYGAYGRSCAVNVSGQTYCWGVPMSCIPAPVVGSFPRPSCTFPGALAVGLSSPAAWLSGIRVIGLALGTDHSCALTDGGALWCWGANDAGQLGVGEAGGSFAEPRQVLDPQT